MGSQILLLKKQIKLSCVMFIRKFTKNKTKNHNYFLSNPKGRINYEYERVSSQKTSSKQIACHRFYLF